MFRTVAPYGEVGFIHYIPSVAEQAQLTRTVALYFKGHNGFRLAIDDDPDSEKNVLLARERTGSGSEFDKNKWWIMPRTFPIIHDTIERAQKTGRIFNIPKECHRIKRDSLTLDQLALAFFGPAIQYLTSYLNLAYFNSVYVDELLRIGEEVLIKAVVLESAFIVKKELLRSTKTRPNSFLLDATKNYMEAVGRIRGVRNPRDYFESFADSRTTDPVLVLA